MDAEGKRQPVHFDDEICLVGEVYYYRGTPMGTKRRREISLGLKVGAKQRDVIKAKHEALEGLERSGVRAGAGTFEYAGKIYVVSREDEAKDPEILSAKSLKETKTIMLKHLIPFARSVRLENIDQPWFNDYCRAKKNLNLVNHRKVLNHFMRWTVAEGFLKYRPDLVIPKWATKPRRKRVVLSDEESLRLFEACKAIDDGRILLYVLMYSLMGMRNMEICKVRWDEINLETGVLRVNPMNNRTRKSRVIPINSIVLRILRKRAEEARGEWVFPSLMKGTKLPYMDPSGAIRKPWAKVLKHAGIVQHVTPHDMRAFFETHMHLNTAFTDTQREKMAGARIDVQKNDYVTMSAGHLKGLEESVQIDGLKTLFGGGRGGKSLKRKHKKRANKRKKGLKR